MKIERLHKIYVISLSHMQKKTIAQYLNMMESAERCIYLGNAGGGGFAPFQPKNWTLFLDKRPISFERGSFSWEC